MDNIDFSSKSLLRNPGISSELPFCIRTLGSTQGQAGHVSRGTYFEDVMLTWFPKGKGLFFQSSGRMKISAGMLGLVLPEEGESLMKADTHDPYTHYYCRFAGDEARKMARRIRRECESPFFVHPKGIEIGRILEAMVSEGLPRDRKDNNEVMSLGEAQLAFILSMLCTPLENQSPKPDGLYRAALSEYMLQQLSEPVSLELAAGYFNLSKSYFCRECKRLLGLSYQKAMEREKMLLAVSLLQDGMMGLTVSEVAYQVGYNDPLYFSKVFKRFHGVSPSGRLRNGAPTSSG